MKNIYIKPVYDGSKLISLALCYSNHILVDEDIIEHFPYDYSGVDIKKFAVEWGYVKSIANVKWGSPINN